MPCIEQVRVTTVFENDPEPERIVILCCQVQKTGGGSWPVVGVCAFLQQFYELFFIPSLIRLVQRSFVGDDPLNVFRGGNFSPGRLNFTDKFQQFLQSGRPE